MQTPVDEATFDRAFAESAGVHLWTYVQVRLGADEAQARGYVSGCARDPLGSKADRGLDVRLASGRRA